MVGVKRVPRTPLVLHNLFLSASHWLHCRNLFTHSPSLPFLECLTVEGGTQWRTQEFCLAGVQQIQLRTENGDLGAVAPHPLVKGSGGSCNLEQEISFHIVKVS